MYSGRIVSGLVLTVDEVLERIKTRERELTDAGGSGETGENSATATDKTVPRAAPGS